MPDLYEEPALAYVRGSLPGCASERLTAEVIEQAKSAGLKLHRFKRTNTLPRVRAVIGALRAISPQSLLDIGSGRGVFLWPLLDAFPALPVTAVEPDERRFGHLQTVHRGGLDRLRALQADASKLTIDDGAFDVVTVLEVLEHQNDPTPLARACLRLAQRFVIASVPSKPDDNPEHVQLFNARSLSALLGDAGAKRVKIDYVHNHIIAVASVGERASGTGTR